MKRRIVVLSLLMALIVTITACVGTEQYQAIQTPQASYEDQLTHSSIDYQNQVVQNSHADAELPQNECIYSVLEFIGSDAHPQGSYLWYSVTDPEFIAQVWETIRYNEWTERSSYGQWDMRMDISFSNNEHRISFSIDPDSAVTLDPDSEVTIVTSTSTNYFNAPEGTYQMLSQLLTAYSAENFYIDFTPQAIYDAIAGSGRLESALGGKGYAAEPSKMGNFFEEWDMQNWKEIMMRDDQNGGETILIFCGNVILEGVFDNVAVRINIFLKYPYVAIYYKGVRKCFEINQETADVFRQQFNEFYNKFAT